MWSLYIVKLHAFSIFFWTLRFFWSMKIIVWDTSYFRHSNNIHTARASLQRLLMELQWKWRLQVLFRQQRTKMNVFKCFSIKHAQWLWFCALVFLRKIAHPKNRAHRIKFVQPWKYSKKPDKLLSNISILVVVDNHKSLIAIA